jgi:hypothetical protein
VGGLEPRLLGEVREGERAVREQGDHPQRLVFIGVAGAAQERLVPAERGADDHLPAAGDLEGAAVRDLEGHLHERAGLADQDQRIDAGERPLAQLRDGGLLPVARFQLGAQTGQLRIASVVAITPGDEVEQRLFRH